MFCAVLYGKTDDELSNGTHMKYALCFIKSSNADRFAITCIMTRKKMQPALKR